MGLAILLINFQLALDPAPVLTRHVTLGFVVSLPLLPLLCVRLRLPPDEMRRLSSVGSETRARALRGNG